MPTKKPTKKPTKTPTKKQQQKTTPFIPTKRQRRLINKAYKAISESLTTDEFISFDSTLYNGEVPFEFTLEYLQSLTSVDLFQDEYINLLYEAFDTYSIFEQFLQERDDDRVQLLEERELRKQRNAKKKKKKKLSDYDKYLIRLYHVLYDKKKLYKKRLYLLHTLRRILTVKTGIEHNIPHYYSTKEKYKPFWYDDWVNKKKTESKQLKKINDIIELEQIAKAIEKLEQEEKENKLKEQLAQLQSMFNINADIDTNTDTNINTEIKEI